MSATTSERIINLNTVDKNTNNLLHGFIRSIQQQMSFIIPDPIIVIILSFYYFPEYFKDFDKSIFECIDTDNAQIKAISTNGTCSSIYGNIMISSDKQQKCYWKIRLNQFSEILLFGISSTYNVNSPFFVDESSYNYCYYSQGCKESQHDRQTYGKRCEEGDIITMVLDCKLNQISFHKNNEDMGIAYDNIVCGKDINYKMSMYLWHKNTEIELLEFSFL